MKFLALDSPVLDIILMKRDDLLEGACNESNFDQIVQAYDELMTMLIGRQDRPGDKNDLEVVDEINSLESAIETLRRLLPKHFKLYYIGGSGCRKLHHIFATFCDAHCTLMGAIHQSPEGELLRNKLKESYIDLLDNDVNLPSTRKSLIYTLPNEKDRVVLRFPFQLPKKLYSNRKLLNEKISDSDVMILETSRVDLFGIELFLNILKSAVKFKKHIVFLPPTNRRIYKNPLVQTAVMEVAIHAKLMVMNAEEAINSFLNTKYSDKISGKDDEKLNKAINKIQSSLKDWQFAVVTLGAKGAFGITSKHKVFINAQKTIKPVNTLGAGDALCGGVIAKYFTKYNNKVLTPNDIKEILLYGSQLAALVIQQPGGLIDSKEIACMWEYVGK